MFSISHRLRSPFFASLLIGFVALFSMSTPAQILEDREAVAAERLSDGKDNGGNLSFDAVTKQFKDIQHQLRLELFIARTALSLSEIPMNTGAEVVSPNDLDRVIESFEHAVVIPTTKKLFVETVAKDGIETVRVSVDAVNNSMRGDIQINIYSWAVLDWCQKAQLVLHEHMGLERVEKSLEYNLSAPLIAQTSFCRK